MYVTAHRCAGGLKKKLDLRSGSERHRHFVGFFNVPVLAPTRGQPFYDYSEKPPISVAFSTRMGTRKTYSLLTPTGSHGGSDMKSIKYKRTDAKADGMLVLRPSSNNYNASTLNSLIKHREQRLPSG